MRSIIRENMREDGNNGKRVMGNVEEIDRENKVFVR